MKVTEQPPVLEQQPGLAPPQVADQSQPRTPQEGPGELEEARQTGHVKPRVYTAYAMAAGPFLVSVILISLTLMQVSPLSPSMPLSISRGYCLHPP